MIFMDIERRLNQADKKVLTPINESGEQSTDTSDN